MALDPISLPPLSLIDMAPWSAFACAYIYIVFFSIIQFIFSFVGL